MMNRRAFLKLSAGALVLAAAGGLTGCGGSDIDPTSGIARIGDVTFICAKPFLGGGASKAQLAYWTQFTIRNESKETVTIEPENIVCYFYGSDGSSETLRFRRKKLTAAPGQTVVYNGAPEFYLDTDDKVAENNSAGTYQLRIAYDDKNTLVFVYDGSTVSGHVETKN